MAPAYCPHCLLSVTDDADGPFPPQPMRCPHCRLGIAAGRARTEVGDEASSGSAAGVLMNAAKREDSDAIDPDLVVAGLTRVAAEVGVPVARLRMLDYQRLSAADPELPGLGSVLGTCGSWKKARQLAADAPPA